MMAKGIFALAGLLSVPSVLCADALVAESPAHAFGIDTMGSPYSVQSVQDAQNLVYLAGETVTATAPGGAQSTLVSGAAQDGTVGWTATAGGIWTLANSGEGEAQFCVRYSLFGTQGAGTVADPLKVVDNDELSEMVTGGQATSGSVFALLPPLASVEGAVLPAGYAAEKVSSGVYRLVETSGGMLCADAPFTFLVDAVVAKDGSRRYESSRGWLPVAYSGDGWAGGESAASTLTFAPEGGVATNVACVGTGAHDFEPGVKKSGTWTVTLTPADGEYETLVATLKARMGFILVVE